MEDNKEAFFFFHFFFLAKSSFALGAVGDCSSHRAGVAGGVARYITAP